MFSKHSDVELLTSYEARVLGLEMTKGVQIIQVLAHGTAMTAFADGDQIKSSRNYNTTLQYVRCNY